MSRVVEPRVFKGGGSIGELPRSEHVMYWLHLFGML
jgi:hypothetical protein